MCLPTKNGGKFADNVELKNLKSISVENIFFFGRFQFTNLEIHPFEI